MRFFHIIYVESNGQTGTVVSLSLIVNKLNSYIAFGIFQKLDRFSHSSGKFFLNRES